jgi:hypothetical protein
VCGDEPFVLRFSKDERLSKDKQVEPRIEPPYDLPFDRLRVNGVYKEELD